MTHQTIQQQLEEAANTEAGRALKSVGLVATHQGGGLINFEGTRLGGRVVTVVASIEADGWGPSSLSEPVTEYDVETGTEQEFPSLASYLESLTK